MKLTRMGEKITGWGEFTSSGESFFFIHLCPGSEKMATYPYYNILTGEHTDEFYSFTFHNAVNSYAGFWVIKQKAKG